MDVFAFIESANVRQAIIAGEILQIIVLIIFIVLFPPCVEILTHNKNKNIIFAKMMFLFLLCVKISTQGGNNTMKIIKTIICKISPAIIACLTLALSINANTSTCFVMYQPKTPAKLYEFKKIK